MRSLGNGGWGGGASGLRNILAFVLWASLSIDPVCCVGVIPNGCLPYLRKGITVGAETAICCEKVVQEGFNSTSRAVLILLAR
jgi:hypothetical protein